jgi:hypothetical protein
LVKDRSNWFRREIRLRFKLIHADTDSVKILFSGLPLGAFRGRYNLRKVLAFALVIVFLVSATALYVNEQSPSEPRKIEEPYVGVAFCGNTTSEAELLIDKVQTYTNLFVLQSGPVSKNETATNIICDYAVAHGLKLIVFFGWFDFDQPWQIPWLDYAKNRWGDKFLGLYLYDEPGGIQLDYNWNDIFHLVQQQAPDFYKSISPYIEGALNQTTIRDYEMAQKQFSHYIRNEMQMSELFNRSIPAFTADYALYWFDYLAGYDTVLVELGWDNNVSKQIGLCRGAADAQKKDWGTIIVWNSRDPDNPNSGSYKTGSEMLADMKISYQTGAKYIVIFNYPTNPPGNPYGILTDEHFLALQDFWTYMQKNGADYGKIKAQAALVLPKNYGWGMRHLDDRIWGYWGPDENSQQIWNITQTLLNKYGLTLDIVYDDPAFPVAAKYQQIYFWNSTTFEK